jgi:hypothetical protein
MQDRCSAHRLQRTTSPARCAGNTASLCSRVSSAVYDAEHGHREKHRIRATQVAIEWLSPAAARATAMETARIALAPSRPLFGVPSSSRSCWSVSA